MRRKQAVMKKTKRIVAVIVLAVFLIPACLFTAHEFDTFNAPAAVIGLVRVCLLDAPYAQIGFLQPAFLGNPDNGFNLFLAAMEEMGYTHLPEEQMGALHWFTDAEGNLVKVLFRINAYYSRWVWC